MTHQPAQPGVWYELSVEVDHEAVEAVVELFARYGYNEGVVIDEPFVQDRDGDNVRVDVTRPFVVRTYIPSLTFDAGQLDSLREGLWHLGRIRATGELTIAERKEEDWANAWKAHYQPVRIGRRVVVRPPWQTYEPATDDVVVVLDPGMAFGTGTHPTTRIAVEQLEECTMSNASILDVGTGSGIVAIAAALLGARSVDAVDIDDVAVRQAQQNVLINQQQEIIRVWHSSMADKAAPSRTYDVVVANIIARILIEISDPIAAAVRPGGTLVLSGIIEGKEEDVVDRYRRLGFELITRRRIEDWIGQTWVRRDDEQT